MVADTGANLPSDQRILLCDVVADQQHCRCVVDIRHRGQRISCPHSERGRKTGIVRSAVMVEIVRAERDAREAVQQIIFFVGGVVRANHADGSGAVRGVRLFQPARDFLKRVFPAGGLELSIAADQRLADALGIRREVVSEAALGAEELAVDARVIAIIGAQNFVVAHA